MAYDGHGKLVLKPGRFKLGFLLFIAVLVAFCGVGMALDGRPVGWGVVAAAGLLAPLGGRVLISPRRELRLNHSGFAFGTLLCRYAYSWSDVQSFGIIEFGPNRWVFFNFAPGLRGDGLLRRLSRRFGGFDRCLVETYGLPADELARVLESWRVRHGGWAINPKLLPQQAALIAC